MSVPWAKRLHNPDKLAAPAIWLGTFLVYLATLAPTVATNDAGRFQIAAPLLGTGHPTGYPTFILVGKLFTYLPFGDIAYRLNLMAAFFGAVAAVLLYLLVRELGGHPLPAAGAALLAAFSSTIWRQATVAEVYTMHAAFLLGITLLLLRWRRGGNGWLLPVGGLLYGLSLGNNAGMALFAPAFLILLFAGRLRDLSRPTLAGAFAFFILGLSVYAYVPIRGFAGAWHNYGDPVRGWGDVWALISGARFQGLMGATPSEMAYNAARFAGDFATQAALVGAVLIAPAVLAAALYGAVAVFREDFAAGAALSAGIACAFGYAINYKIDDISVYYIPVYLLLYALAAVGVTEFAGSWRREGALWVPVVAAVMVCGVNYAPQDRSGYYEERDRSEAILARLPQDAVLYGELPIVPMTYVAKVEGAREDVTLRWADEQTLMTRLERDLESGRPVFLLSDPRYNEERQAIVEPYARWREEDGLVLLTPR